MKRSTISVALVIPVLVIAGIFAYTQINKERPQNVVASEPVPYRLVKVADGLSRPIYLTHSGDGTGRMFAVEQDGKILVIDDGEVLDTPFLDVASLISQEALGGGYTERGLLGLAFHPDYAENGIFFINYTDRDGNTILGRYTVSSTDPNWADPDSASQLLYVGQPYSNHNGGHLAFGPDGYLYVSLGDGGSGGDPQGNGQNRGTLLGTLLRLDVDSGAGYSVPDDNPLVSDSAARPEIWAWGLRNVWRFSFDRETGDLYIADVGQNAWEEINFQPASSVGGENYGWNAYEGNHTYSGSGPASGVVPPILEYDHRNGWCSVTGGYVYRGEQIDGLQGYYMYGDWCTGTIWAARPNDSGEWEAIISLESGRAISSFGEDEAGELYLVDHEGTILRFEPDTD